MPRLSHRFCRMLRLVAGSGRSRRAGACGHAHQSQALRPIRPLPWPPMAGAAPKVLARPALPSPHIRFWNSLEMRVKTVLSRELSGWIGGTLVKAACLSALPRWLGWRGAVRHTSHITKAEGMIATVQCRQSVEKHWFCVFPLTYLAWRNLITKAKIRA